jgi:hypothetical protein
MGEAKQRGTFEQRKTEAVARNEQLIAANAANKYASAVLKKHGVQRVATKLKIAGVLHLALQGK